jgi:hypothetical protein
MQPFLWRFCCCLDPLPASLQICSLLLEGRHDEDKKSKLPKISYLRGMDDRLAKRVAWAIIKFAHSSTSD